MTIDEITDKIIENKNNDIAKAFTMHIGSLLLNNGIVPVMTEYTGNDVKNITDTNEYKLVMEYGIAFKELDCSKHDKEIYNKAIDDFAEQFIYKAVCEGCSGCCGCYEECRQSECEDYKYYMQIAEQLKAGGKNE